MGNMQLKEIVSIQAASINPMDAPDKLFHLYSLPSFDENQKREEVYGRQIQSNKSIVPDKCILFNKLNVRFQRIWLIDNDDEDKICSTEFLPLIVDETKVDFYYCYFLLHSPGITNYLTGQNTNTSGSHKRIDPDDFLSIEVQLPTLPEQKRIGKFLYEIEKKITVNRQINDYLEAMARQLYDYWFVQYDFPDEDGSPYKSSGGKMVWCERLKRYFPDGWNVLPLKDISEIVNGATPSTEESDNYGGEIVWITPKDLSNQKSKFTFFGERNITQKGYDSCSTTLVKENTILLSSRAPIGLLSIAKCKLCTNQGFKSISPMDTNTTPYLYYFIKEHLPQIEQLGSGTTFKEVSRGDIEGFPIMYPPKCILDKWTTLAKGIFEKQFALYQEVVDSTKMRDELIPLLMNGQVSVRPLNNHLSHD